MRSSPLPVVPLRPTQTQMFYDACRYNGVINSDFMFLVDHGLTKEDLQRNIERRPSLWARFSGFLDKLPSRDLNIAH